jgi:hypothetical protein
LPGSDKSPDGPSTITSRAAAKVSPTSAMRPQPGSAKPGSAMAMPRTHSVPVRVLPAPRPPSTSQIVQPGLS